jgi:hypothetical protein
MVIFPQERGAVYNPAGSRLYLRLVARHTRRTISWTSCKRLNYLEEAGLLMHSSSSYQRMVINAGYGKQPKYSRKSRMDQPDRASTLIERSSGMVEVAKSELLRLAVLCRPCLHEYWGKSVQLPNCDLKMGESKTLIL